MKIYDIIARGATKLSNPVSVCHAATKNALLFEVPITISPIAAQQTQTITLTGLGFGTHPPYNGDSNFISIGDCGPVYSKKTCNDGWEAGYAPDGNTVTLNVSSWTQTNIVIAGFTGAYGTGNFYLSNSDYLIFSVWNANSGKRIKKPCVVEVGSGVVTSC